MSVRWSVHDAFVKIEKYIGKSLFFAGILHVHPFFGLYPIILSLCLLLYPSVCTSIHTYVSNQIVKIEKSIAKSSEINWSQWYNSMEIDNIHKMEKKY